MTLSFVGTKVQAVMGAASVMSGWQQAGHSCGGLPAGPLPPPSREGTDGGGYQGDACSARTRQLPSPNSESSAEGSTHPHKEWRTLFPREGCPATGTQMPRMQVSVAVSPAVWVSPH